MKQVLRPLLLGGLMISASLVYAAGGEKFVRDAIDANQTEIELGKLGEQKAQDPQIKQFAQKIINDHQMVEEQLKQTLSAANMPMPPKEISKKHQKILKDLQEDKPENFDKDYLKAQAKAHKEAISLFEKEAKDDSNPPLASFAKQQLPNLQEHMNAVKELQKKR